MSMRIATAKWADPSLVEQNYAYRDGAIWLGRSASENQVPVGYLDDRHVCLVSGSRGGKGTTSIIPTLLTWPGSVCVVDPKGENATVTAARRGKGSEHCQGLGQAVQVLDPFKAAQVGDSLYGRFNPLDALDPANDIIAHTTVPTGLTVTLRGMVQGMRVSFRSFALGLCLAVVLLYLILVAQFQSFVDPFIILLAVPRGMMKGSTKDWNWATRMRYSN